MKTLLLNDTTAWSGKLKKWRLDFPIRVSRGYSYLLGLRYLLEDGGGVFHRSVGSFQTRGRYNPEDCSS
jgi:hypothetical protein